MRQRYVVFGLLAGLAGCMAPLSPQVQVMPGPGKSYDVFLADQRFCGGVMKREVEPLMQQTANAQFANVWGQLATAFAGNNNVVFGLMNEPAITSASTWLGAANAAISAIGAAQAAAGNAVGSQEVLIAGLQSSNANAFASSLAGARPRSAWNGCPH